jgi:hypothetical protein
MRDITANEVRTNLLNRYQETEAEAVALEAVKINTKHKTLTNRAIEGGRIGDYLSFAKALYVSYTVTYQDGSKSYKSLDINAYSYHDENGKELGAEGCIRISRTVTPGELAKTVTELAKSKRETLQDITLELENVPALVKQRNELANTIHEFNEGVSYASGLKLREVY